MKTKASITALPALTFLPTLAHAHEGHGLGSTHWHATDAWGFAVGIAAIVAIWVLRRK